MTAMLERSLVARPAFLVFLLGVAAFVASLGAGVMHLASMLGIDVYSAKKVIDILSAASTVAAVVGIVAAIIGSGGLGIVILYTAKKLAEKYGKEWATMW